MAALPSSEVLLPALATGVGVVAAAVFIASGSSSSTDAAKPERPDEDSEDEPGAAQPGATGTQDAAAPAAAAPSSAAAPVPAAPPPAPRKRLTPEQEATIRKRMAKLPPEARKALDDWAQMKEGDKWAIVAMNCLVLVLFLGVFVLLAAYLIGAHGINVFELQTWRRGFVTVRRALHGAQGGGGGIAHDAEL
mmetsp:Transcript_34437/g.69557  ORF Transcript_34437/g.69557 Transcript_34437/m.69557 type:complete len:192 (+) Transcript_34437:65-640(+)